MGIMFLEVIAGGTLLLSFFVYIFILKINFVTKIFIIFISNTVKSIHFLNKIMKLT